LIKIRVLAGEHATREGWHGEICTSLHAAPVQHIGKILVVYRPLPKTRMPKRNARSPIRRSAKPRAAANAVSTLSANCRLYTGNCRQLGLSSEPPGLARTTSLQPHQQ
jgi:hypothetical protein